MSDSIEDAATKKLLSGLRQGLDNVGIRDPEAVFSELIEAKAAETDLPIEAIRLLFFTWVVQQRSLSHLNRDEMACESPIESLFFLSLVALLGDLNTTVQVEAQATIAGYRVDFLLTGSRRRVVVECDGHEFHEKTKEQAARDKKRDRAIVAAGYYLLRFTGSELWAGPLDCALEALRVLADEGAPSK